MNDIIACLEGEAQLGSGISEPATGRVILEGGEGLGAADGGLDAVSQRSCIVRGEGHVWIDRDGSHGDRWDQGGRKEGGHTQANTFWGGGKLTCRAKSPGPTRRGAAGPTSLGTCVQTLQFAP